MLPICTAESVTLHAANPYDYIINGSVDDVLFFLLFIQNIFKSRDTSVIIFMGYEMVGLGSIPRRARFLLALGSTQSPIQWIPVLFVRAKSAGE